METITCAECGLSTPAYDIINYGSMDRGYRQLCGRCFNVDVARLAGLDDFEHVRFEPVRMTDANGRSHEFHFRVHLFGSGVSVDALELLDGNSDGYEFQMIGEPEDDLMALLGKLIEKMRRALALRHIEDGPHGLQITDAGVVRARISCDVDEPEGTPRVIIDGQDISWADFGRMLMTYEGWQFKLEIGDKSDEL